MSLQEFTELLIDKVDFNAPTIDRGALINMWRGLFREVP